jgi:hypothetical protein
MAKDELHGGIGRVARNILGQRYVHDKRLPLPDIRFLKIHPLVGHARLSDKHPLKTTQRGVRTYPVPFIGGES